MIAAQLKLECTMTVRVSPAEESRVEDEDEMETCSDEVDKEGGVGGDGRMWQMHCLMNAFEIK